MKMRINANIALSTPQILLVPYSSHHVPCYHSWMANPEIQELTASEPLSIEEEYEMQKSWRNDGDKLTFIICRPKVDGGKVVRGGVDDADGRMVGDVNLFLTEAEEDPEGCIGELELMIAPLSARRKGYGRATILTFMSYFQRHLLYILQEFSPTKRTRLLQLKVKIGSKNVSSIGLFESVGFVKVGEGPNYFGEVELVFEGFMGEERIRSFREKFDVGELEEMEYLDPA
jgi:RimJ/RimL family protein N-acetyltransferase